MILVNQGDYLLYEGALKNETPTRSRSDIKNIMIHHSACCDQSFNEDTLEGYLSSINENHKGRLHTQENGFGNNIAYHFICDETRYVHTRPILQIGYHAGVREWNVESIAICYLGNLEENTPTEEGYDCIARCIQKIRNEFEQDLALNRHKDVKATSCPGKNFDIQYLAEKLVLNDDGYYKKLYDFDSVQSNTFKYPDLAIQKLKESRDKGEDVFISELVYLIANLSER